MNKVLESYIARNKGYLLEYISRINPKLNTELVGKALEFSINAHSDQYRKSGMPYIEHPIEVAKILVDFKMDDKTISAALLHDVVEDCDTISLDDIKQEFGDTVAFLVDGVTKIDSIRTTSRIEQQAKTFRKMLLSMAKDFRVIMIKFADRLHNMRTLMYVSDDKKIRVAKQTLEIFAPLANRFGLAQIKWELEDLSFKYLYKDAYKDLVKNIVDKREQRENYIRLMVSPVKEILAEENISSKVYGRPKHFYSIYRKMEIRQCEFKDIYDLFAVRIIVDSISDCYLALGIVHNKFHPLRTRFKDYIATPKSNMYQSLHTTVIASEGHCVEIQIRTHKMNQIAEYGIAAHWAYKGNVSIESSENTWVKRFLEWQKDLQDSGEFMDFFKVDLKTEEIFVYTPEGALITLQKGSTVLDFAFAVHSKVGVNCIGAKVDGRSAALDKILKTGVTVDVLQSKDQYPSKSWLNIVCTSKAKTIIRRLLREEKEKQHTELGKELFKKNINEYGFAEEKSKLDEIKKYFKIEEWDDFYKKIGDGTIDLRVLLSFLTHLKADSKKGFLNIIKREKKNYKLLISNKVKDKSVELATCCTPVQGESILGYLIPKKGIQIHRVKCSEVKKLEKSNINKIDVDWKKEESVFTVVLEIKAKDQLGILNSLTTVILKHKVQIEKASIKTIFNKHVQNRFSIKVSFSKDLENLMESLKKVYGVASVERLEK